MHGLAGTRTIPRACAPVLPFHVEHDHRIWPGQQIGNDDAHALARSRGRLEQNMLAPAEYQETSSLAADNDAGSVAKALPPDLAFARKPGGAVPCQPAAKNPDREETDQAPKRPE